MAEAISRTESTGRARVSPNAGNPAIKNSDTVVRENKLNPDRFILNSRFVCMFGKSVLLVYRHPHGSGCPAYLLFLLDHNQREAIG